MAASPQQKDAMERLRGNPAPTARMELADKEWRKLQAAIADAMQIPDKTAGVEVEQLREIFAGMQPGENCNGWTNPFPRDDPRSLAKQYQCVSLLDPSQFIMDIWSRQTGKDFTLALVAGTDAYSKPKSQWTIAAPSERQSLESLEKVKDVVLAFGDIISDFREEREHAEALIKSAMITLRNGSRIRAVPGMPHTVRGLTSNVGITEADFLEKPRETMRALLGSIANEEAGRKVIRLITTPNGKQGMTHKIWTDPASIYSKRLITIWHAVCHGLRQNPAVLERALDDPEGWAQEFLCVWLDGSAVLLPYELIATCESFEASESDTPELLKLSPLRKIGGIDFGRVNDPTVMTTALQGLGMNVVRNVTRLRGVSTPAQIKTLGPYIDLCDRVCVDYTGPGIGFGDLAVERWGQWDPEKHLFGKIELCTFTAPFKREIFPSLRVAFEQRRILVPVSIWLREDLHSMAQIITGGQYSYKAPRSDEGHSDGCTSLALMLRAASGGGAAGATSISRAGGNLLDKDSREKGWLRRAGRFLGL